MSKYFPIVLIIMIIAGVVLLLFNQPEYVACTKEAKLCPDGKTSVGREGPNCEFAECPSVEVYCEESQRNVGACIEIYQPVCGWFNPEKIQCIKFPCAQTFSNSCFACDSEDILYYTEGECPV